LAFCFHSASLAQEGSDDAAGRPGQPASGLDFIHGLIAGDATALQIYEVIGRLPCLKRRLAVHFVDLSQPLPQATANLSPGIFETIRFCWTEMNAGTPATAGPFRVGLPPDCVRRNFYAPACQTLWPFQHRDNRAVPEPGLYPSSRYPYGDRLAQTLTGLDLTSDLLYLMYEAATNQEPLDLDAMFADDLHRWQRQDDRSDLRLADFIARRFQPDRLFISPDRIGPALLREMVWQILVDPLLRNIAAPEVVLRELDAVLDGFAGRREEIPVHPRIARHFGFSWWSPDMKYRWMNNLLPHQDYILNYIKWTPWRP
jgi:hypothetical protein